MIPVTLLSLAFIAPIHPTYRPIKLELSAAYSSVKMKGLKALDEAENGVDAKSLAQVEEAAKRVGTNNVFLTEGKDIGAAVFQTRYALGGGSDSGTELHFTAKNKDSQAWAGIYLGNASSSPPYYRIDSAEIDQNVIRVVYSKPKNFVFSADTVPYLIWLPLGNLKSGKYRLELLDGDRSDELALSRRVEVKRDKE